MPALFEQGFFVRVPAWHGQGIVLDDYPGREEAMRLAGHDFDIVERDLLIVGAQDAPEGFQGARAITTSGAARPVRAAAGWKAHLRSDNGALIHVSKDSFERIPNSVAYDFAEVVIDQGFRYETGVTLDGGALCALTLLLDEPITITGDDSESLPYLGLAWAHDGSGALRGNYTTVRRVCANTVQFSEAEGQRNGTYFSIRHTKNWREKIDEAKEILSGARRSIEVYREAMEDLASIEVTPEQRDLFVSTIIGDRDGIISKSAATSDRVKNNIEAERAKINTLFLNQQTIPEAHVLTGYGLHLAGVEYFDHLRAFRSQDSYVKRTLLNHSKEKAALRKTIAEVVAA